MPADLFISAGEASGDLQASLLVSALRKRRPSLAVRAIGGERLRAAGAEIVVDSVAAGWASMGHLRAYVKIPWLLAQMLAIANGLLRDPPRLLVCVDFGAFNVRMLEWLRFRGYRGRALYYFPPAAWLDRQAQARKVARVSDALTPFAHQAAFYRSLGLPIDWYGHPLVSVIPQRPAREPARTPTIAVMPGSRDGEVDCHLPVLADSAVRLARDRGARFRVVAASDGLAASVGARWPLECGGPDAVIRSDAATIAADADVAWTASGTAVLETALRGTPQVAFYRVSDAQYRFVERHVPQLLVGPVTLPNLVLGERIVTELLQREMSPERLIAETLPLLDDRSRRTAMLDGYARMRAALGPPDSLERIAAHVDALLPAAAAAS
jgi:lipid-A-disaccharide synthase